MLNILIISQYFPPDIVGSGARAVNMAFGLIQRGCKVTVITAFPHYPEGKIPNYYKNKFLITENNNGIKVIRVWVPAIPHNSVVNRMFLHLCFIFSSLFAFFLIDKTDIVFASSPNLFSIFPSIFYSFIKRKPIVRNVDDLWPEVFYELNLVKSKWMRSTLDLIAKLSYSIPILIIPISNGYKEFIIKKYNVNANKLQVIEVGVDKIHIGEHSRNDTFKVLYSGMLGVGYDFNIIFQVASILSEKDEKINFYIRGMGELSAILKQKALKYSNVDVETNFLQKEDLIKLLTSADAFILPMRSGGIVDKGLPTKLFEYQSYGKPILCVSSGESARYISETKSGIVIKPRDLDSLTNSIINLSRNKKYCDELGKNGQVFVSQNLTHEILGKKFFSLLSEITK